MLIIKRVLAISVSLIVGYMGYIYSKRYVQRVLELFDLICALQMFETKVRYKSEPIGEAFIYISSVIKTRAGQIFYDTVEYLKFSDGVLASQAWNHSIEKNMPYLSLNNVEKQILMSFGNNLGNSDIDGQIKNINLVINQLEKQVKIAQDDSEKNSKMYKNLGVLGGMALFILLL